MIEGKCWLDEATGKVMFDNLEIAVAFNVQKYETYQEQFCDNLIKTQQWEENVKQRIKQDVEWVVNTDYGKLHAWKVIAELADNEIERLQA